jgi:hypothetical protein
MVSVQANVDAETYSAILTFFNGQESLVHKRPAKGEASTVYKVFGREAPDNPFTWAIFEKGYRVGKGLTHEVRVEIVDMTEAMKAEVPREDYIKLLSLLGLWTK